MLRFFLFAIAIVFTLMAIWLLKNQPEVEMPELLAAEPHWVSVVTVTQRDVRPVAEFSGELQAARKAFMGFDVSGRIIQRDIEPGAKVVKGDVLLVLEADDYQDAVVVQREKVTLEKAGAQRDRELLQLLVEEREIQERELNRVRTLEQQSLVATSVYDDALRKFLKLKMDEVRLQYSVDTAAAKLVTEQARLRNAERDLSRTIIRAPFAGSVSRISVEVGDYVSVGQKVLEIAQTSELDLQLSLPGRMFSALSMDQSVSIEVAGETISGRIIALGVDPDEDTNTHLVRIRIAGAGLLPGQIGSVMLSGQNLPAAKLIPVPAVLRDGDKAVVYRVQNEQLQRVEITLLVRVGEYFAVAGIAANTLIVARDVNNLADGQRINVRTMEETELSKAEVF